MLIRFIHRHSSNYNEGYVNYNVHGLIYITDFVVIHDNLDLFSDFK